MITLDGFRYRGCAEVLGSEALALNAHGSRVLPLGPHRMEDPTHHLEVSLSQPKAKTSYPDCDRINRRLGLIRTDKRKNVGDCTTHQSSQRAMFSVHQPQLNTLVTCHVPGRRTQDLTGQRDAASAPR